MIAGVKKSIKKQKVVHIGMKSKCDTKGCKVKNCHFLIMDCDKIEQDIVEKLLYKIQKKYRLGNLYIIRTSEQSFHIISFVHRSFDEILDIVDFGVKFGVVGDLFRQYSKEKGYFVTRLDAKNGQLPYHQSSYHALSFNSDENKECKSFYFDALEYIRGKS